MKNNPSSYIVRPHHLLLVFITAFSMISCRSPHNRPQIMIPDRYAYYTRLTHVNDLKMPVLDKLIIRDGERWRLEIVSDNGLRRSVYVSEAVTELPIEISSRAEKALASIEIAFNAVNHDYIEFRGERRIGERRVYEFETADDVLITIDALTKTLLRVRSDAWDYEYLALDLSEKQWESFASDMTPWLFVPEKVVPGSLERPLRDPKF